MRRSQSRATDLPAPRQLELVLTPPESVPVETTAKHGSRAPARRRAARRRPARVVAPAPRSPAQVAQRVMELLGSMGYRATEARWLVWSALRSGELPTHRPATQTELLRAALRAGATRRAGG